LLSLGQFFYMLFLAFSVYFLFVVSLVVSIGATDCVEFCINWDVTLHFVNMTTTNNNSNNNNNNKLTFQKCTVNENRHTGACDYKKTKSMN